jgi:ribonucleoside-diphosphate reductase alpha chain
VFDCAFRAAKGERSIAPMGHVKMMAACQPFLSGAISKTVNVPESATAEEIGDIYLESWRLGLKAIAVYRDGCKRSQPLTTKETTDEAPEVTHKPVRRELDDERPSLTHKFKVGGHTGYMTIGLYPDGSPAELFLVVGKEGGVVRGLLDGFATSVSLALQYGVPLRELVDRFTNMSFEPAGWTPNPDVPYAKSILDYVFRYLALKYLDDEDLSDSSLAQQQLPLLVSAQAEQSVPGDRVDDLRRQAAGPVKRTGIDGPPCPECASPTRRNGACYACPECGATTGCG